MTINLKLIGMHDGELLRKYFAGYFKNRKFSHYYMSVYILSLYKFYYAEYNDCLLIMKYGNRYENFFAYMLFPPMNASGDIKTEKKVLNEMLSYGIKCTFSKEDLALYGLTDEVTNNSKNRDKNQDDFIYSGNEIIKCEGSKFSDFRNGFNRNSKLVEAGELMLRQTQRAVNQNVIDSVKIINEGWRERKADDKRVNDGALKKQNYFIDNFNTLVSLKANDYENMCVTLLTLLLKGEDSIVSNIDEFVHPNHVIMPYRVKNYSKGDDLKDPNAFVLKNAILYWDSLIKDRYKFIKAEDDVMFNFGNAYVFKDLYEQKRRHRPIEILEKWTYKTKEFSKENFLKKFNMDKTSNQTNSLY